MEIVKKIPKGNGYTFANDFMESTWKNTVKYYKNFYKQTEDFPFRYSELSSSSALLAGMTASGACVLPEMPGTRKHRGEPEARGRIDAWALHREREYYIEFKHCWYALGRDSPRRGLIQTWEGMRHQVEGMQQTLKVAYKGHPFWVCGMMIVPTYKNGATEERAQSVDPAWEEEFRASRLFDEADWIGHWRVPQEGALYGYPDEKEDERYSYQQSVTLFVTAKYVA
jgi:hypothetical protein